MLLRYLFGNRRQTVPTAAQSMLSRAVAPAVCEALEARRLMTPYSYTVPSSHSAAYIQPVFGQQAKVQVRLDSAAGTIDHISSNATGMGIIRAGSNSNFLFVDQVHAVDKPTSD